MRTLLLLALAAVAAHAQDVHVRVSPDVKTGIEGTTEFPTIQMAMDHHPFAGPGGRVFIEIAPGTYHERVIITQNHNNITFLGTGKSPEDVIITNSLNAKAAGGTFFTETVEVNGSGFEADNLTFENTAGNTGQAVAIASAATAPSSSTAASWATRTHSSPTTAANTTSTPTSKAASTSSSATPPPSSTGPSSTPTAPATSPPSPAPRPIKPPATSSSTAASPVASTTAPHP